MKNFLQKTGLFLAALWLVGNVNAQIQCDNNVLIIKLFIYKNSDCFIKCQNFSC